MSRLVTLLALLVAIPTSASATTPDTAVNPPVSVEQARDLVSTSEIAESFRAYAPTRATEVRFLIVVDRPGRLPDLALRADGSLWMVSRGHAVPATNQTLTDAGIGKLRLSLHLQARKIRPIALRVPASWIVSPR